MPEPVQLTDFYSDTRAFLTELAQNNTRDWFAARKGDYDRQLKRPAEKLLAQVAARLEPQNGPVKPKLFRPHRDMRFSQDKTPYHTHLHLMWSLPDGRAWMFGLSPQYCTAGAGIMGFSPPQLERWRAFMGDESGAPLAALLAASPWRLSEPDLKRTPAPFAPDHPRATHLRRKSLIAWVDDLDEGISANPSGTLGRVFEDLQPVVAGLERVAG